MIRTEKFTISRRPYAIRPETFRADPDDGFRRVDAVWFRRKEGVTAACIGEIRGLQRPRPSDLVDFLARWDGRHGGDCHGRWDGRGYWGSSETPGVQAAHLEILRPMLAAFPEVPTGYDGWWVNS